MKLTKAIRADVVRALQKDKYDIEEGADLATLKATAAEMSDESYDSLNDDARAWVDSVTPDEEEAPPPPPKKKAKSKKKTTKKKTSKSSSTKKKSGDATAGGWRAKLPDGKGVGKHKSSAGALDAFREIVVRQKVSGKEANKQACLDALMKKVAAANESSMSSHFSIWQSLFRELEKQGIKLTKAKTSKKK